MPPDGIGKGCEPPGSWSGLFFQIGEADSTLAELALAPEELRKADKKDLVYTYESKALLEHSISLVQRVQLAAKGDR